MGKIKAFYTKQGITLDEIIQAADENNPNRPAWIQVKISKEDAHFICYDGDDGTRTYYELRFDNVYLPIDAIAEEVLTAYDHLAKVYDELNPQSKEVAKFIKQKVHEYCPPDIRAIDIFAGTGIIAAEIADYCSNIDLADISEGMIEQARRRVELVDANFIVANLIEMEFEKKYDLVVCSNGFQYLRGSESEKFIDKLSKSQPSGGHLINIGRTNTSLIRNHYKLQEVGLFEIDDVPNIPEALHLRYFVATKK